MADREFGAVAALWSVVERLRLPETLDTIFPKRNSGPSIGTYLLVGALSWCYELFDETEPELQGELSYRTTRKIWGNEYQLVITYNPELFAGQTQGIEANIAKCQREFNEITAGLERWRSGEITKGKRPTVDGIKKRVQKIIARQYMKELWQIKIMEEDGFPKLQAEFDQEAFQNLRNTRLGKTIIFTDRDDWSDARIINCYRSQWRIEEMFKWSKDRTRNSWETVYHWTDPMIRMFDKARSGNIRRHQKSQWEKILSRMATVPRTMRVPFNKAAFRSCNRL